LKCERCGKDFEDTGLRDTKIDIGKEEHRVCIPCRRTWLSMFGTRPDRLKRWKEFMSMPEKVILT